MKIKHVLPLPLHTMSNNPISIAHIKSLPLEQFDDAVNHIANSNIDHRDKFFLLVRLGLNPDKIIGRSWSK